MFLNRTVCTFFQDFSHGNFGRVTLVADAAVVFLPSPYSSTTWLGHHLSIYCWWTFAVFPVWGFYKQHFCIHCWIYFLGYLNVVGFCFCFCWQGGWGLRIYFTFGICEVPSVVKSKLVCTKKGRREWKKSVFLRVWSKMTHSKIIWTVCYICGLEGPAQP